MSDYVTGMTIVGANGKECDYRFPSDNPEHDNALKVINQAMTHKTHMAFSNYYNQSNLHLLRNFVKFSIHMAVL